MKSKRCPACEETKLHKFFYNKNGKGKPFAPKSKCRRCENKRVEERRQKRRLEDPVHRNYRNAMRKARNRKKGNRVPAWADREKIKKFYARCGKKGFDKYVVDHVIPFHGKNVCGLHVHENLQIITHKANLAKGNR